MVDKIFESFHVSVTVFIMSRLFLCNAYQGIYRKVDGLHGTLWRSSIAEQLTLTRPDRVNRLTFTCFHFARIAWWNMWCRRGNPSVHNLLKLYLTLNNQAEDVDAFLSVNFPSEWIKAHPNYLETIPRSTVVILLALITGTEDIAIPSANFLILAQNIPGA